MPELPEVEVVKRSLNKKIQKLIIKKVKIIDGNLRYQVNRPAILKLIGKRINKIYRRSKFLIFELSSQIFILVHLGMTGKFFFVNKKNKTFKTSFYYNINDKKDNNHNRVIFYLENNIKLIYNDVRKFGFIKILNLEDYNDNPHLINLGPEPLESEFSTSYFKDYIERRNRSVKDILMDQRCVSGLGNIYVNEILFKSGIIPTKTVSKLKVNEVAKIVKNTKRILKRAIKFGGSSIKNFSSDDGKKGDFQQNFKVYGRNNKECSNADCNNLISRIVISNRSTFYCTRCQK